MAMKDASIMSCPKPMWNFGRNKIEQNRLRDKKEQRKLASLGWHCITIWECQLKPKVCQHTLESLVYTLSHIFLEDRKVKSYEDSKENLSIMAAEMPLEYDTKEQALT